MSEEDKEDLIEEGPLTEAETREVALMETPISKGFLTAIFGGRRDSETGYNRLQAVFGRGGYTLDELLESEEEEVQLCDVLMALADRLFAMENEFDNVFDNFEKVQNALNDLTSAMNTIIHSRPDEEVEKVDLVTIMYSEPKE